MNSLKVFMVTLYLSSLHLLYQLSIQTLVRCCWFLRWILLSTFCCCCSISSSSHCRFDLSIYLLFQRCLSFRLRFFCPLSLLISHPVSITCLRLLTCRSLNVFSSWFGSSSLSIVSGLRSTTLTLFGRFHH